MFIGTPGAGAAPFTQTYSFTGSPAGTAGWTNLDNPSPNPWYTSSIGTGGLRMAPTGNGGLVYDNAYRSGFQIDAPAGATITRAILAGVDALQQDRQRTRINLLPQPSTDVLNGTEPWGKSTTNDGDTLAGIITLTPAAGATATGLQVRHYPVVCGNPDLSQPPCATVPASTAAHARISTVTLALDDPSAPAAALTGPADGWTNASSVTVTAVGADPQSGVSRLALQIKTGSATRTETLGTWTQDTTGNTLPGWATPQAASSSVALPRSGTTTITALTRNGANTESGSTPVTVRIDRTAPQITWPKKLEGGQTATVRDGESGLGALAATIDGKTVKTSCAAGSKQCKVTIPSTGNGQLRIVATDQAGNSGAAQRSVSPKPRQGGAGGSGSDGSKKQPDKSGTKKHSLSYCKKFPQAQTCKTDRRPSIGRSRQGLLDRVASVRNKTANIGSCHFNWKDRGSKDTGANPRAWIAANVSHHTTVDLWRVRCKSAGAKANDPGK